MLYLFDNCESFTKSLDEVIFYFNIPLAINGTTDLFKVDLDLPSIF